jgi:hypothetical protein
MKTFRRYRDTKSLAMWMNGAKPVLGKKRTPGKVLNETKWCNLNDEKTSEDMKSIRVSHRDSKSL